MDTRYFKTFREVAKWQNFTRAAEELGYAQSSVTAQIQNLEQEFGTALFERWGRKIRLTNTGEQVLRYAEQVLAIVDEAKTSVSGHTLLSGTLTIGTVESLAAFYLPPILQTFRREYPKMKLMLRPGICSDLRQGVREGVYDFAIILDSPQSHHDLVCLNLGEIEMVMITAPEHRLAGRDHVSVEDFRDENLIVTEAGCSYRAMMEGVLRKAGIIPDSALEFGSLEAIKRCVEYDLGIALLPKIAVQEEVQKGRLAILSFQHPDIKVCKQLIYHKKKGMSQTLSRLLELIAGEQI
jgi:DNA-binding transcriptional LysR family regulator